MIGLAALRDYRLPLLLRLLVRQQLVLRQL